MKTYNDGLEEAKNIYRNLHIGGCKVLSKSDACNCFLCQCDNLKTIKPPNKAVHADQAGPCGDGDHGEGYYRDEDGSVSYR